MSAGVPASPPLVAARYALLVLTCATALFYLQWRLGVMNPAAVAYSWIVFAAELIGFARTLMFLLSVVRFARSEAPPAPAGLAVDVFVTSCDEPAHIVRRTMMAALAIRYPHETWLLDDGERPEMERLAHELGCRYAARTGHADAKAGNLNHALTLAQGAFVALFDADHVASTRFLDRTLGYFRDAQVAFVQTPQEFFNVDSYEHLNPKAPDANSSSLFHSIVQGSRDRSNCTMFSGCSAVFRRSALDAVAGFATGTINEDIHTSLRLHAAGWKSRFHPEILSAGLAPLDAAAFCGQRLRWAQDAVQILLRENPVRRPGLSSAQRIAYLIHVASNLEGWRHAFIYALPVVILVTGVVPVRTGAATFLAHFIPYFVLSSLACAEMARGHIRIAAGAVYNLARCPISILASLTAHRERQFRVTPKTRAGRRVTPDAAFAGAVAIATLGAIAFACGEALAGHSPLAPGALAVVVAWAMYHVITAARLLILGRRCARDRRARTRFAVNLGATLFPLGEQIPVTVEVIAACADGLTLRAGAADRRPPPGDYRGTLELAGERFPFELKLREAGLGGSVRWAGAGARAAFDLRLHQAAVDRFAASDRGGLFGRTAESLQGYRAGNQSANLPG